MGSHHPLTSHSRAAAFWFQQPLSGFFTHLTLQAAWIDMGAALDALYHDCPHHFSSLQCPPSTILSSPISYVPSSPKLFFIPQPEMICPPALCLGISCVQCWMYEPKVSLCLQYSLCYRKLLLSEKTWGSYLHLGNNSFENRFLRISVVFNP